MNDIKSQVQLQDVYLLFSETIEDEITKNITIDLIHFMNNEIDIQLGNYSKIPTWLIMKQVKYSKEKQKLIKIWNILSSTEQRKFYEKMKTDLYSFVLKTNE